jgi:hypothetical protein
MRFPALLACVVLGVAACGRDEAVSRTLGARCDLAAECDERCLTGAEYPGGFCSITCDRTDECPSGAYCIADTGQSGVCLFSCARDTDCAFLGTGWRCQERDAHPSGKVMVCRGG